MRKLATIIATLVVVAGTALAAIPAAILVQLALLPPVFKMTKVLG